MKKNHFFYLLRKKYFCIQRSKGQGVPFLCNLIQICINSMKSLIKR